jgi:uncharacterized membrane protein
MFCIRYDACQLGNLLHLLIYNTVISYLAVQKQYFHKQLPAIVITVIFSLNILLGVHVIRFVDRTDLFKIINLVFGRKAIITSLYSSLKGQRQTEREKPVGRVQGFI